MECGQYNEKWHLIHMFPEECIEMALKAKVQKAMPVHWAGFSLAQHPWTEPAERFVAVATDQQLTYTLPRIGQVQQVKDIQLESWWK
jgi:L-ascorbate metabolism protein UlaG (beta-lactamase superfamily)